MSENTEEILADHQAYISIDDVVEAIFRLYEINWDNRAVSRVLRPDTQSFQPRLDPDIDVVEDDGKTSIVPLERATEMIEAGKNIVHPQPKKISIENSVRTQECFPSTSGTLGYIMQPGYYPRHNIYNTHTQPQRYGYDASRNIRGHYPYHDSLYYGQLPPGALHNQGYITQPGYYPRHNIYNTQTQPQRYGYDGSRNIRGPYPYHNSLYYGQLPPGALHNQGYITQPGYYPRHNIYNTQTQPQRYAYDACRNIRGPYPYHDRRYYVQFQPGTLHNPGDPYTVRLDSTTGIPANYLVRR